MEGLILGLVVIVAAALALIAYRRPREYESLGIALIILTLTAFVGAEIWNTAIFECWNAMNSTKDSGPFFSTPFARIRFIGLVQARMEQFQIDPALLSQMTLRVIAFLGVLAWFPCPKNPATTPAWSPES